MGWGRAHRGSAIHSGKGIGVNALTHGELVRNLEERGHAEHLGQVGADAGEHEVVEGNIALDLSGESLYRAGVGEAKLGSALGEGVEGITEGGGERVAEDSRSEGVGHGSHGAGVRRLASKVVERGGIKGGNINN